MRNFLQESHHAAKISQARQQVPPGQVACVPGENEALRGCARASGDFVALFG
jgi:hypothetical protein